MPVVPDPPSDWVEGRRVKVMKSPSQPSQEEIDRHNVAHCPFRSWCKLCVMGQSVTTGHFRARQEDARQVPTVSMDYMFMKDEDSEEEEVLEDGNQVESGMPIVAMVDDDQGSHSGSRSVTWSHTCGLSQR